MPGSVINQLLMERYKQFVETLYTEPKEEEILGTFLQLEHIGEQDLAPVAYISHILSHIVTYF